MLSVGHRRLSERERCGRCTRGETLDLRVDIFESGRNLRRRPKAVIVFVLRFDVEATRRGTIGRVGARKLWEAAVRLEVMHAGVLGKSSSDVGVGEGVAKVGHRRRGAEGRWRADAIEVNSLVNALS